LQIEYEGKSYAYDLDDITLKQAMKIEAYLGMRFSMWAQVVKEGGDLKALQVVGWLLLENGDLDKSIDDVDFKIGRMRAAFDKAAAAEAKPVPEAEPRPTVADSSALQSNGTGVLSPLSLTADS
jgi:hypothetical protein